jgi:hypothetical protein
MPLSPPWVVPATLDHILHIIGLRADLEMVWIDAQWLIALVSYD